MPRITTTSLMMVSLCCCLHGAEEKAHDGTFHKKQGITGEIKQLWPKDKWRHRIHFRQDQALFSVDGAHTVWCNEGSNEDWPVDPDDVVWSTLPKDDDDNPVVQIKPIGLFAEIQPHRDYPEVLVRARVKARPHPGRLCSLCQHVETIADDEEKVIRWEENQPIEKLLIFQTLVQIDNPKEGVICVAESDTPAGGEMKQINWTIATSPFRALEATPTEGFWYTGPPVAKTTGPQPENGPGDKAGNGCTWILIAGFKDYHNDPGGLAVNGTARMEGALTLTPVGPAKNQITVEVQTKVDLSGLVSFGLDFLGYAAIGYLTGGTACLKWVALIKSTVNAVKATVKDAVCQHPERPSVTGMIAGSVVVTPGGQSGNSDRERESATRSATVDACLLKNLDKYEWNSKLKGDHSLIPPWNSDIFRELFTHSVNLTSVDPEVRKVQGRGAIEAALVANPAGGKVKVKVQIKPYRLIQSLAGFSFTSNRKTTEEPE